MPIYEYRCSDCGNEFEATQRITEDPLTECISCGGKVKKLISSSSFHLKGTGWYVTDYANKSGDNGSNGSNGSSAEKKETGASSSTTTTDTKDSSASKETTSTKETASPASS